MNLKNRITVVLCHSGVSADFLTLLGLAFAFCSGIWIYLGNFFAGAVFLLVSGVCDLLDGAVARWRGNVTAFGGIYDSSLDRYGDAFVLGGIIFYFARVENYLAALLAFSALVGSFSISYVRARAECEIENCRVGFWERGERSAYLILGLFLNNLLLVLWVLGIFTHWTALQRLLLSKGYGRFRFISSGGRNNARYFFKALILVLAVLFLKLN